MRFVKMGALSLLLGALLAFVHSFVPSDSAEMERWRQIFARIAPILWGAYLICDYFVKYWKQRTRLWPKFLGYGLFAGAAFAIGEILGFLVF